MNDVDDASLAREVEEGSVRAGCEEKVTLKRGKCLFERSRYSADG